MLIKPENYNETYSINIEIWEQVEFSFDPGSNELKSNVKGRYIQYPIKLAYAMTIHKSQGKTFDNIQIDIASVAFAHGQTYVALSRCRTLEGIVLNREIRPEHIIVDQRVIDFYNRLSQTIDA